MILRATIGLLVALVVGLPCAADACRAVPECATLELLGRPDRAGAMLGSADPEILARAAVTLAHSREPRHLAALGRALRTRAVVVRLTRDPGVACGVNQILRALAKNSAPQARKEYLSLLTAGPWGARADGSGGDLTDALLRSTAVFRPPSAALAAFWNGFTRPDDGFVSLTVSALAENATPRAATLLESLLLDRRHHLDERIGWLRTDLVRNRHQVELLRVAGRLFRRARPTRLRWAVIEAVFDYRHVWYGTCGGPGAPPLSSYLPDARRELRSLAATARRQNPSRELASAIHRTMAELDRLDASTAPER